MATTNANLSTDQQQALDRFTQSGRDPQTRGVYPGKFDESERDDGGEIQVTVSPMPPMGVILKDQKLADLMAFLMTQKEK